LETDPKIFSGIIYSAISIGSFIQNICTWENVNICLSSFLLSCRIVSFVLRISKELTPQRQLKEDAVLVVDQLMVLVQYTAELYQELQVLYRLEKDYEQKRREEENSANSSKGDGLAILKTELKAQRKVVKSLKKKSLWSRGFEEVMEKLVDIVHFLLLEIHNIFGGADDQPSKKGAAEYDKRLGPAGLALHYANIIVQIDTLVSAQT
jgi:uncharacterized membrane protein YcjF (UPF0283 family)